MSKLPGDQPKTRPKTILIVILCVLLSPFLIYGVIVGPQLLTNRSISHSFSSVQLPSNIVQTRKDCGVHDPVDVGAVCYYDFVLNSASSRTQLRDELSKTLKKSGCEPAAYVPANLEYYGFDCRPEHISILIQVLPSSDRSEGEVDTQINKIMMDVTKL